MLICALKNQKNFYALISRCIENVFFRKTQIICRISITDDKDINSELIFL
ncbi:hypothetical protein IWQ47_002297 [Aquimarina sp. EL_43]|nr:hypothetical protein [Aquimarina sp. EL_35]MBG6151020.1 hypothetical protein [Aquimarina sp. EL_32]MBG6169223.1 hypothetical protein [Aquimarina sp. EL_43]